jgi:hypothetical protein
MRNTADVIGGKPIAILLQSISDINTINPLVAFYDIHGGKREVLFFYFVSDTTRDNNKTHFSYNNKCTMGGFIARERSLSDNLGMSLDWTNFGSVASNELIVIRWLKYPVKLV